MLAQHRDAFFQIADVKSCWIGIRDPNPLADRWITSAEPKCYPKPETCKAKTSDVPDKPWGGLVVSPLILPDHFTSGRLAKAVSEWAAFASQLKETEDPDPKRKAVLAAQSSTLSPKSDAKKANDAACGTSKGPAGEYSLIIDGPRRGVVLYHGAPIFADYDVYAVVGADGQGRMVAEWSPSTHTEKYWEVAAALNRAFKFNVDMVQHGADFDWTRGTATAKGDYILWFGPKQKETLNPPTDGQFSVTRVESARKVWQRGGNDENGGLLH